MITLEFVSVARRDDVSLATAPDWTAVRPEYGGTYGIGGGWECLAQTCPRGVTVRPCVYFEARSSAAFRKGCTGPDPDVPDDGHAVWVTQVGPTYARLVRSPSGASTGASTSPVVVEFRARARGMVVQGMVQRPSAPLHSDGVGTSAAASRLRFTTSLDLVFHGMAVPAPGAAAAAVVPSTAPLGKGFPSGFPGLCVGGRYWLSRAGVTALGVRGTSSGHGALRRSCVPVIPGAPVSAEAHAVRLYVGPDCMMQCISPAPPCVPVLRPIGVVSDEATGTNRAGGHGATCAHQARLWKVREILAPPSPTNATSRNHRPSQPGFFSVVGVLKAKSLRDGGGARGIGVLANLPWVSECVGVAGSSTAVFQLRDLRVADTLSVYMRFQSRVIPAGAVRGAIVVLSDLKRTVSDSGAVYCSSSVTTAVSVLPRHTVHHVPVDARLQVLAADIPITHLVDVQLRPWDNSKDARVLKLRGRLVAVLNVTFKWVCGSCHQSLVPGLGRKARRSKNRAADAGACAEKSSSSVARGDVRPSFCSFGCTGREPKSVAEAAVVFDDGTSQVCGGCAGVSTGQCSVLLIILPRFVYVFSFWGSAWCTVIMLPPQGRWPCHRPTCRHGWILRGAQVRWSGGRSSVTTPAHWKQRTAHGDATRAMKTLGRLHLTRLRTGHGSASAQRMKRFGHVPRSCRP